MSKSEPSGISAEGRQRNNLQSVCSIFLSSSPIRRNRKKRNERKGGTTKMVAAQQEEGGSRGRDSVLSCTRKSTGIGLDQFRRLGSLESSGALEKKRRNTGRREWERERERKRKNTREFEAVGPAASHMWYGHYDTWQDVALLSLVRNCKQPSPLPSFSLVFLFRLSFIPTKVLFLYFLLLFSSLSLRASVEALGSLWEPTAGPGGSSWPTQGWNHILPPTFLWLLTFNSQQFQAIDFPSNHTCSIPFLKFTFGFARLSERLFKPHLCRFLLFPKWSQTNTSDRKGRFPLFLFLNFFFLSRLTFRDSYQQSFKKTKTEELFVIWNLVTAREQEHWIKRISI